MRDEEGTLLERRLLRVPDGTPVAGMLDAVLRLALEERRCGRTVSVDAPPELVALLAVWGLGEVAGGLRP